MADIIDQANDYAAQFIEQAKLHQSYCVVPVPDANGRCLNCKDPVAESLRWCDDNCRDDWQLRNPRS